ncbi:DUF1360 domain-containing protein [Corallococcus sp. AB030]|uniref:DUF1360 domain-containing protein n=1 Tax=Corallococcus TaxID=83461 RepID=UPI000ED04A5A|nr:MULTISPECIES: DUF1360 domain-containing protein [Corallococcus]NRD56979.1 DUF1360 domain-containing protein [Corallococcus exiguus]RKI18271.1 DUF1360 domain-containing protein [Corallococcus sp. AB030]RUO88654.1 DUF1360 domain-containing protein [Corallococcus sp. AB018]
MKALQETGPFAGYDSDHHPLGSYAALIGTFSTSLVGFLGWMNASGRRLPERLGWKDLALFGVATHAVTRLVALDRVFSVFRAPFTRYESDSTAGEVVETARGEGPRRALGELLDCPFCLTPWVASGFMVASTVRPRETRFVASVFALSAASFFLHRAYERVGEGLHRTRAQARILEKEQKKDSDAGVQFPGRGPQVVEPGRAPIPSPS